MKLLNMTPAEKIAYIMTRLYDNKLTTTSGGNLSIMDDDGVMWISPSGVDISGFAPDVEAPVEAQPVEEPVQEQNGLTEEYEEEA